MPVPGSPVLFALRREVPACAFSLWTAVAWLALALALTAAAPLWLPFLPPVAQSASGGWAAALAVGGLTIAFGVHAAAATSAAFSLVSPGRWPERGAAAAAVVVLASAFACVIPFLALSSVAPTAHAASASQLLLGVVLVVNAAAAAAWTRLAPRLPRLAGRTLDIASDCAAAPGDDDRRLRRGERVVLAVYLAVVTVPHLIAMAVALAAPWRQYSLQ